MNETTLILTLRRQINVLVERGMTLHKRSLALAQMLEEMAGLLIAVHFELGRGNYSEKDAEALQNSILEKYEGKKDEGKKDGDK